MQNGDLRIRANVPRSRVPAITHVDYSARIQTVDVHRHRRFYWLMPLSPTKPNTPWIDYKTVNSIMLPFGC